MDFLKIAFDAIPTAATSPYAFLAYLVAAVSWIAIAWRVKRNQQLLASLQKLPKEDRLKALQAEMGTVALKAGLSPEQWLRSQQHKYYFMAFLALCIVALVLSIIAARGGNTSSPNADERQAVLNLIRDVKAHPMYLTMFFVKKHSFIDKTWHKNDPGDKHYESAPFCKNLFELVDLFAISRDLTDVIEPACTTFTAKVKDVDIVKLDGADRFVIHFMPEPSSCLETVTLSFSDVDVCFRDRSYVGDAILNHINDPFLPTQIRASLHQFRLPDPDTGSLRRAIDKGRDFLLISPYLDNAMQLAEPKGSRYTLAVHADPDTRSLTNFVNHCVDLFNALQEWAAENQVPLDLLEKHYFPSERRPRAPKPPGGTPTRSKSPREDTSASIPSGGISGFAAIFANTTAP